MSEFVGCLAILFVFPVVIYVLMNVRMMNACKNCGWTEKCSEFEIIPLPWG